MTDSNFNNNLIKKLVLGTAQLGLPYGINNKIGQPSRTEALEIIKDAVNYGISAFDTAQTYGSAEEILGEAIADMGLEDKIKVISRSASALFAKGEERADTILESGLRGSLSRLNLESLDAYLLNNPEDIYKEKIRKSLESCRDKGLIKHFGVSVYEEKHALDAARSGLIDYIQIPYNVLDQKWDKADFFKIAEENKVTVFARSAFLQGLILMSDSDIPASLSGVKKYLRELDEIISAHGYNRLESAILYSVMNPKIDYAVFGVDSRPQLKQIAEIVMTRADNFLACRQELEGRFPDIEKNILMPNLWLTNK